MSTIDIQTREDKLFLRIIAVSVEYVSLLLHTGKLCFSDRYNFEEALRISSSRTYAFWKHNPT